MAIGGGGGSASATAVSAIAIGPSVSASGNYSLAIGDRCSTSHLASIAIGLGSKTSANNEFVAGGYVPAGGYGIYNVYFGTGPQGDQTNEINGDSYAINGSGGFGTDKNGGNLTLAGGKPTGSGIAGDVIISTSTTGASGTTLRTLTNRWWVKGTTGTLANVSSPNASAALQVDSTTQGFLPPRMTTAEKNLIATPAAGLMVYDTDLARPCFFNGATWITL